MINKNFTLDTLLNTWFTLSNNSDLGIQIDLNYNFQSYIKYNLYNETFFFENLNDLKKSERFEFFKSYAVICFYDTMYYQHSETLKDRYPFKIALFQI